MVVGASGESGESGGVKSCMGCKAKAHTCTYVIKDFHRRPFLIAPRLCSTHQKLSTLKSPADHCFLYSIADNTRVQ